MRSRFGGRRTGGCVDSSSAGGACAVRVPPRAGCAPAPPASSEQTPAKATDMAQVPKRILPPIQTAIGPQVSDYRGNGNCWLEPFPPRMAAGPAGYLLRAHD